MAFIAFVNIYRSVVLSLQLSLVVTWLWLLHGWYHVKLLPSGSTFCVHRTTMHHSLQCRFLQRHIRKVPVYLAVTRHLAPGSFTCYRGNTGVGVGVGVGCGGCVGGVCVGGTYTEITVSTEG